VAFFLVALLDALSTYLVITLGLGVEANPAVADVINSNPAAVFPLALVSAAPLSMAAFAVERLASRLPEQLRSKVVQAALAICAAAVLARIAVVVNNLALLAEV